MNNNDETLCLLINGKQYAIGLPSTENMSAPLFVNEKGLPLQPSEMEIVLKELRSDALRFILYLSNKLQKFDATDMELLYQKNLENNHFNACKAINPTDDFSFKMSMYKQGKSYEISLGQNGSPNLFECDGHMMSGEEFVEIINQAGKTLSGQQQKYFHLTAFEDAFIEANRRHVKGARSVQAGTHPHAGGYTKE